jgi:hypothetical protein
MSPKKKLSEADDSNKLNPSEFANSVFFNSVRGICPEVLKSMDPFEINLKESDVQDAEKQAEILEKATNVSFEPLDTKKRTEVRNRFYPQNLRNKTINRMRKTGSVAISVGKFNMVINPTSGTIKMDAIRKQNGLGKGQQSRLAVEPDSDMSARKIPLAAVNPKSEKVVGKISKFSHSNRELESPAWLNKEPQHRRSSIANHNYNKSMVNQIGGLDIKDSYKTRHTHRLSCDADNIGRGHTLDRYTNKSLSHSLLVNNSEGHADVEYKLSVGGHGQKRYSKDMSKFDQSEFIDNTNRDSKWEYLSEVAGSKSGKETVLGQWAIPQKPDQDIDTHILEEAELEESQVFIQGENGHLN